MMRAVVPWNRRLPQPLDALENEFAGLMERFLGANEGWGNGLKAFTPKSNLAETEISYEVSVELPGMKPEEFNVEFRNGELWITGEKKQEEEETGKTFHRIESRYGEFRRVYKLPSAVNQDQVQAEYKNGILRVTVPKAEELKPKRVEVKA